MKDQEDISDAIRVVNTEELYSYEKEIQENWKPDLRTNSEK